MARLGLGGRLRRRRSDQASVYDDDFLSIGDNETFAELDDDDYTLEDIVIDSQSPTEVPLSPPTAVQSTNNVFTTLFGGKSGASASTILPCGITAVLSVLLLLRDV